MDVSPNVVIPIVNRSIKTNVSINSSLPSHVKEPEVHFINNNTTPALKIEDINVNPSAWPSSKEEDHDMGKNSRSRRFYHGDRAHVTLDPSYTYDWVPLYQKSIALRADKCKHVIHKYEAAVNKYG